MSIGVAGKMFALLPGRTPSREPVKLDYGHQIFESLWVSMTCRIGFVCYLLQDAEQIGARDVNTSGESAQVMDKYCTGNEI